MRLQFGAAAAAGRQRAGNGRAEGENSVDSLASGWVAYFSFFDLYRFSDGASAILPLTRALDPTAGVETGSSSNHAWLS